MPFANENHKSKNRVGEFLTYCYDKLSRHKFLTAGAVLLLCAVFFLAGAWYGKGRGAGTAGPGGRKILHYVDPMNPAHTSPEPGLAPCGMKMEPVYADEDGKGRDPSLPPGAVKLNSQRQQLLGVRVAPVEKAPYTHNLRALGKVAIDETLIYRLNSSADGWIRKTFDNATGAVVKKDEVLAIFYAPEFLGAEQAYIFALSSLDRFKSSQATAPPELISQTMVSVQQYVDALRNLGMSDLQISEMERTRQYNENIYIMAPATSFIIARNVSPGQRFDKGTEWYRLADLRRVWVLVDLYENEAQYIKPGEKVQVTYPYQKKTFQATVSQVLPIFDPATRTLKVRLELDNPDYLLRPDMFVDAVFPIKLPPTISVPVDAVLDSGLKKTVFVDRGNGYFEPRKVETGWRLGDRMEITRGLQPGEKIVVSGNFLIDSESRMKLAAAGMFGEVSQDPVCGMNVDESKAKAAGRKSEYGGRTYYFCADQCKEKFARTPGQYLGQAAAPAPGSRGPDVAKVQARKTSKDPVCGMDVDEASATEAGRTSKYQGQTYYFCSDACKQRFDNAPQSFLGKTAAGHGQENAPSPAMGQETPASTRDPVCNMDVREPIAKAIAPKTVYQGRTYYFCSELCKQVFDKNPERFVGQAAASQLTESGPRGYLAITAEAGAGRSPVSLPPGQAQPGAAPPGSPPGAMTPGMPMAPPAQTPAMPLNGGQTPGAPMGKDIPRDIRGRPMGPAAMAGAAGSIAAAPGMPRGGHQAHATATGPKDPVCGMVLEENQVKNTPWKSKLHGRTYYFCSQKCKQEFDQDPERYQGVKAEGAGVVKQTMRMPAAQPGAGSQQHD
jgi:Cu(I)/Ag(I) efflux system membrane fusion protein